MKKNATRTLIFIVVFALFACLCETCFAVGNGEAVTESEVKRSASAWVEDSYAGQYMNSNGVTLCMGFVADFWSGFGYTRSSAASAKDYADARSLSFGEIPIGADVFFNTGEYWHIGVYVGNDEFVNVAPNGSIQYSDIPLVTIALDIKGGAGMTM